MYASVNYQRQTTVTVDMGLRHTKHRKCSARGRSKATRTLGELQLRASASENTRSIWPK